MTEREWREASDMRQSTVSIAAILIAAAVLRVVGLGAGIPHAMAAGEAPIVERAVAMMRAGSLHPHSFEQPSLFLYLQAATATARFVAGATRGEWASLDAVAPADFYLWGRGLTAAFGTLTVLIVYLIGLRWGTRPALLGAGLLAVMPLHVRESHYVLTHVPLTFFIAVTWLLALRAHEQPRAGTFAAAGTAAGLAAATSYAGALALLLPLVALWMTPATRPSRITAALLMSAAFAAGFLLGAPYTVLDLPGFLNGYAALMAAPAHGAPPGGIWTDYLGELRRGLQWPAFLLMLGGGALALVRATRGPGRVRWTLALAFPILYLWLLSRGTTVFGRHLLPLVPFVCILTATAVVSGVSLLRRFSIPRSLRTALIVGLTVATLLPAAVASIRFARAARQAGTATLAYSWIAEHVPHDAAIVIESGEVQLPGGPHQARHVRQLRDREYDHYVAAGVDYLVASSAVYGRFLSAPDRYPRESAEYIRLFEQSREVARFTPSADHPGPELRILAVRR